MRTDKNKEMTDSAIAKLDAAKRAGNRRVTELRLQEHLAHAGSASATVRSSSSAVSAPKPAESSDVDMFESLLQPRSKPHAKSASRRVGKRSADDRDEKSCDSKAAISPEAASERQSPAGEPMPPQVSGTLPQTGILQTRQPDLQEVVSNADALNGGGREVPDGNSGLTDSAGSGVFSRRATSGEDFKTLLSKDIEERALLHAPEQGLLPVVDSSFPDSTTADSWSDIAGSGMSDLLFRAHGQKPQPENMKDDHGDGGQSGLTGGHGINSNSVAGQQVSDIPDSFELMLNSPVMGEVRLLATRIPTGWRVQLRLAEFAKAQWLRERHGFVQRGLSRNLGADVELQIVD